MDAGLSKKIETLLTDLVAIRSETGTASERDIEDYLDDWLGKSDYFIRNPEQYGQHKLKSDPLERSVVWGLVRGSGKKTVILMHHHDTADTPDYGTLAEYACDPEKLQQEMKYVELPDEAKADLESGKWIFGRGTGEMKGGAAIQLALLEACSRRTDFSGNLLLLSVPDGECLSAGMREGLNLLKELKNKFDLDYQMMIGSKHHDRDADGEGIFYEGTSGKLFPLIYVRGEKTHTGKVFGGLNPILLLSEIILQTEMNTDFSEVVSNEVSPPPYWGFFKDRKVGEDASLPLAAGGYLNIISLSKTPEEIIGQLKKVCEISFHSVIKKVNTQYKKFRDKNQSDFSKLPWRINVKTFSEIYEDALDNSGHIFIEDYDRTVEKIRKGLRENEISSVWEATFRVIEKTLAHTPDLSPVVVIALSPPYYPKLSNADFTELSQTISGLSGELIRFAGETWGESYKKLNYDMRITGMSYAAFQQDTDVEAFIESNMPLWKKLYELPLSEMKELSVPIINIGPWGKDSHKFTERVFKRDVFERTPELLEHAVESILISEASEAGKAGLSEEDVYELLKSIYHLAFHKVRKLWYESYTSVNSVLVKLFAYRLTYDSFEVLRDNIAQAAEENASPEIRDTLVELEEALDDDSELEEEESKALNLIRSLLSFLREDVERILEERESARKEKEKARTKWSTSAGGSVKVQGAVLKGIDKDLLEYTQKRMAASDQKEDKDEFESLLENTLELSMEDRQQALKNSPPKSEKLEESSLDDLVAKIGDQDMDMLMNDSPVPGNMDEDEADETEDGDEEVESVIKERVVHSSLDDLASRIGDDGLDDLIYGRKPLKKDEGDEGVIDDEEEDDYMGWVD
ncbi:MAG: hypothetical protein B6245_23600 [Desulfobacteraceae bacterium 4572_88]|nr:MAG: hypothetical protein B6245_23600 [Desulfobacteraceae bacterium 4572_88]